MCLKKYVIGLLLLLFSIDSFAHGLIESPASRSWMCGAVTKPDQVDNGTAQYPFCGTAFAVNPIAGYSFMTVVTHALGRASVTPLPKHVCSFDSETWKGAQTPWDVPMDWPTNPMSAGTQEITWNITWGPHFDDTAGFRYWITKPTFIFSPTRELTWNDFEATPFCDLTYDDKNPTANPNVSSDKATGHFTTKCTVPARNGHHVIYGEWGRIAPTFERFHGCIDAGFSGVVTDPVVAQLTATPANANIIGTNTIAFSAAGSQGTNLSYYWSIESPNPSLYSFSNSDSASTSLSLKNPQAETAFTVRLTVSDGISTNSTTKTFTHLPAGGSSWADMGMLSATARSLNVGDKVQVRMVDASGVDSYFPTTALTITAENMSSTAWPFALAQAVNNINGSKIQIGVLTNNIVTAAQTATTNRIYAVTPTTYVSAFLNVISAPPSQCNWYGTVYPICTTTASGWGFENNKSCIATVTCVAQPAPYGLVPGNASSSVASSRVQSSSSSVATSITSKSSSSVASSTTSSVSSSVVSGGVIFQDDFEDGAVNTQPTGWDNYLAWVYNASNVSSANTYALIDNSKAYTGTKSIHFKGSLAEIVRALPAGTQRLHMRAYVNLSKKMGNDAADNHEHIMGIKKTQDANNEVRVGQIKGVLGTNDVPSDNIAPTMNKWFGGTELKPNVWYCVETAMYADTAYDQLYMWVNGALVHSITSDADWNNGALGANWLSDKFHYAMFGFHSFDNVSSDVWMDNIVVSTQPIGCGISSSSSSAASSSKSSVASSVVSSVKSSSASSVTTSVNSSVTSSLKSSAASSVNSSVAANNCAYVVADEWNTGFVGVIRIKNNRTTAINGWSVNWAYSDGSKLTNSWNVNLSGVNPFNGTSMPYNGTISPGQTVEFGFQGTKGSSATAIVPVVTGAECN